MFLNSVQLVNKKRLAQKIFFGFFSKKFASIAQATFETNPYSLHNLKEPPHTSVTVTRGDAIEMFTKMYTIRQFEAAAGNLYRERIIRGFCHLYSGQEAVAVGIRAALRSEDSVITSYRAHAWAYVMGVSPEGILAEATGRQSGCARGKGGSMHMYYKNFYGGNAIVGAQVPMGVGIAFAAKYKNTGGACVILYGEGASNQGQVYESYNMAKLWDLPCIFLCENNGYGMGTSAARSSSNTVYYTKGDVIPGILVDGMDVLAMREAACYAVNHCSSGKGPIILEAITYRYSGHSLSDPGTSYRTREEVENVRATRDPIMLFKKKIISSNLADEEELKKLEKEIQVKIQAATKLAKEDKEILMDEIASDIYSKDIETNVRGISKFITYKARSRGGVNISKAK